jgi:hypothetical protein
MIAAAVSAFMFAATLTAIVFLQRSFQSSIDFSRGTTDQQRVLDYIARDLRRALTVTVSGSNQTLTVTVPDTYSSYDSQGNPSGSIVTPTITSGKVNYGDPTKPVTICYYLSGNQMLRQQTIGATGAVNTLVIADSVELLQSSFQDLTSIITYSVTFAPDITTTDRTNSSARLSTTLTGRTSVRNARRN